MELVDHAGRGIVVLKEPRRIVSLGTHITEVLFALDAGDKIVGVDDYSTLPREAVQTGSVKRVGYFIFSDLAALSLNIDLIIEIRPDLVIASTELRALLPGFSPGGREMEGRLAAAGIPIFYLRSGQGLSQVMEDITLVGRVVGGAGEAQALVRSWENRVRAIADAVKDRTKVKVWMELGVPTGPPLGIGSTVRPGAPFDELIQIAGGRNIFTDKSEVEKIMQQWNRPMLRQAVIAKNPEVIIQVLSGDLSRDVLEWREVDAVKYKRVYMLNTPSPLQTVDFLATLVKILHPDAVPSSGR